MAKTHRITAEVEVKFRLLDMPEDEHETAYPVVGIEYTFAPGSPAVYYQNNGDPGWPAEPAEVQFARAKLIDGDGLDPTQAQINEWAEDWLNDAGYDEAVALAIEDNQPDPDYERDKERDDRPFRDDTGGDFE